MTEGKKKKAVPSLAKASIKNGIEGAIDEMDADGAIGEENRFLKAKLGEMERKLREADELNKELSEAKTLLSDEIVELSKVLFEEANGMVANEVKARTQIESTKRKLQTELDHTKDRLRLESQQLVELRQILRASSTSLSPAVPSPSKNGSTQSLLISSEAHAQHGCYFNLLFSDRRFNSKSKCNGSNADVWSQIISSIDPAVFQSFAKLMEIIGKLDDESVLGNPFVRSIYDTDVAPCLNFDAKPKTYVKRIVEALFKNTCSIELVSASNLPSPIPIPTSPQRPVSSTSTLTPTAYDSSFGNVLSEMAVSLSILPDMFTVDAGTKEAAAGHFCFLCGTSLPAHGTRPLYKFRLREKEPSVVIDEACRNRIVASAEFYTFLRHLRKGLYSSQPIVDLYFEHLHYLRNMFYVRSSGCTFFVQSDLESLIA